MNQSKESLVGARSVKHCRVRTCVGCSERHLQSELVRFNLRDDTVVLVKRSRDSRGRSIYLCPREACFDALKKQRRIDFNRSKHNRVNVTLSETEWFILRNKFISHIKNSGIRSEGLNGQRNG